MMRVIGIGGEPCSGKSTAVLEVVRHYNGEGYWLHNNIRAVTWMRHSRRRLVVLGEYVQGVRRELFGAGFGPAPGATLGTDGMPQAAHGELLSLLRSWSQDRSADRLTVLFEGNALFNEDFLAAVSRSPGIEAHWIQLTCPPDALTGRHRKQRRPVWRLTAESARLEKLRLALPVLVQVPHVVTEDTVRVAKLVVDLIEKPWQARQEAREQAQGGEGSQLALFFN